VASITVLAVSQAPRLIVIVILIVIVTIIIIIITIIIIIRLIPGDYTQLTLPTSLRW
jgi:hypothetical protein